MSNSLTAFDIIVLLIIGGAVLYALLKGFTTMLLSVAAWAGAIILTLYAMPVASAFARSFIEPPTLADVIALPVIFLITLVALKLVAGFVGGKVKASPVGFLDRSLGAALGLFLGILLVSTAYMVFAGVLAEKRHPDWVKQAQLKPLVVFGAAMVAKIGPDLFNRIEEDKTGRQLIDSAKTGYAKGKESLKSTAETVYQEQQRQVMDEKIEELLKSGGKDKDDKGGSR